MTFTKYIVVSEMLDELSVTPEEIALTEDSHELELELELNFDLIVHDMGRPAVMYLGNGDPGYPAEAPDYEIELKTVVPQTGNDYISSAVEQWVDLNYEALGEEAFNQLEEGGD